MSLEFFVDEWSETMDALPWISWPMGQCAVASLLLVPVLRIAEPNDKWHVVVGEFKDDEEFKVHCWVQSEDHGKVVDPTVHQFKTGITTVPKHKAYITKRYVPHYTLNMFEEAKALEGIRSERKQGKLSASAPMIKYLFDDIRERRRQHG